MNRNIYSVLAAVLISSRGLVVMAHADGGQTNGDNGDIQGTVQFREGIALVATADAPAGAKGEVEFEGENDNGTNSALLLLSTEGLSSGTYTVNITDISGSKYDLGTVVVGASSNGGGSTNEDDQVENNQGGDNQTNQGGLGDNGNTNQVDYASWTNWIGQRRFTNEFEGSFWTNCVGIWTNWYHGSNSFHQARIDQTNYNGGGEGEGDTNNEGQTNDESSGKGVFVLPAGLNPTDVASISIADFSGVVDLIGDFSNPTNVVDGEFDADCVVVGDTNAPAIQGHATIKVTTKNGRQRGKFLLKAQGAPARTPMIVLVNGVARGTARSDRWGNLKITNIKQKYLTAVKTVVAIDRHRNRIFTVKF